MLSIARNLLIIIMLSGAIAMPVRANDPSVEQLAQMQQFIGLMQVYYGVINAMHEVAMDPDKSAILQLQKIEEIYKSRGDRAEAIAVLREVVERTSSATVRNAAAVMLADALNETGIVYVASTTRDIPIGLAKADPERSDAGRPPPWSVRRAARSRPAWWPGCPRS